MVLGLRLRQPVQQGKPFFPVALLRKPVFSGWGFFRAERGTKVWGHKSSVAKPTVTLEAYFRQNDGQATIKKQKKPPLAERLIKRDNFECS